MRCFRPGSLAITIDAIGIFVIALGAAPINIKLGYYAGFWGFSVNLHSSLHGAIVLDHFAGS